MREAAFLRQNADRWQQFEELLKNQRRADPDQLAELFVQLTDDLAYARTYYPDSKTTQYLNTLAGKVHQAIYRNRKEKGNRLIRFWKEELPLLVYEARREIFYSFLIFSIAMAIGALSTVRDDSFARLILGDYYVNMSIENIERGDPMAVYKDESEGGMFARIALNNLLVSFLFFVEGLGVSVGTAVHLVRNGIMIGTFHALFFQRGEVEKFLLTVYIHGTLEITAIIFAGGAGLLLGNSILFPKTYSRRESLIRGAKKGIKLLVGVVPFIIIAAFLEGFVTRYGDVSPIISGAILTVLVSFVIGYFILYPYYLNRRAQNDLRAAARAPEVTPAG